MSSDKKWREFWIAMASHVNHFEHDDVREQSEEPTDSGAYTHVVEHAAFTEAQDEIARLNKIILKELSENDELGAEFIYVRALKAENQRLREVLEFYGNLETWETDNIWSTNRKFCIMTTKDMEYFKELQDSYCGKRARQALKEPK